MRERNVAIARSGIEAFNRGDVDAVLALASPHVEVYAPPDSPNPGRYEGHAGYLQWTGQWLEAWDSFWLEVLDIEAVDDRHVVALVRQHGRGRLSGADTTMEAAHLYEIDEDGRIVRFQLHDDRERALESVVP
jgi:ketosteroid isomerase-like protein